MIPDSSDPNNPAPEPSPQDDWGDAVQLVRDDSGGSTVLPSKREVKEKTVITIIESDATDHEVEELPDSIEEQLPATKLRVREIIGRKISRLRPNRSNVEKVPRKKVSHLRGKSEKWEIEGKEWSKKQKFKVKWMVGVSLGILSLIIGCVALVSIMYTADTSSSPASAVAATESALPQASNVMKQLLLDQDKASAIYAKYACSSKVDEILPLLRDPKEVEPLIRASGHKAIAPKGWQPASTAQWTIDQVGKEPYGILTGSLPDFSDFEAYFLRLHGKLVMDWKATTGYGTASFSQLSEAQGDPSEIRGVLLPGVLYTMAYPEQDYQSYQFVSPRKINAVWCYVKRDTNLMYRLSVLFTGGGIIHSEVKPKRVTLSLKRGPKDSLKNQWLIKDLLSERWIYFKKTHQ